MSRILTEDEERQLLIIAARAEYIRTGKTNNISQAVRWYVIAHEKSCAEIPTTITGREEDRPKTILDDYERPKCRRCGEPMFWKGACATCKGRAKKNQWICKHCGFRHITKDTLQEAIAKLNPIKENGLD